MVLADYQPASASYFQWSGWQTQLGHRDQSALTDPKKIAVQSAFGLRLKVRIFCPACAKIQIITSSNLICSQILASNSSYNSFRNKKTPSTHKNSWSWDCEMLIRNLAGFQFHHGNIGSEFQRFLSCVRPRSTKHAKLKFTLKQPLLWFLFSWRISFGCRKSSR